MVRMKEHNLANDRRIVADFRTKSNWRRAKPPRKRKTEAEQAKEGISEKGEQPEKPSILRSPLELGRSRYWRQFAISESVAEPFALLYGNRLKYET